MTYGTDRFSLSSLLLPVSLILSPAVSPLEGRSQESVKRERAECAQKLGHLQYRCKTQSNTDVLVSTRRGRVMGESVGRRLDEG